VIARGNGPSQLRPTFRNLGYEELPVIYQGQTPHNDLEDTGVTLVADVLGELDTAAVAGAAASVGDIDALTRGSGMLVVKRGPNARSRFRLDQPVTAAGRHPASDIVLDDITVSRRHAEFLGETANSRSSTSAASTTPTSTVTPCTQRCWPTAMRSRSATAAWYSLPAHEHHTQGQP
jgi:hypothetical protein